MGDELEQVLRGKMLHDVLYAIPISHPIAVEIDRLTAELAEVREEAKVWKDRYRKRGYVMDEHAKVLERAEVAEAELAEASTIANNNYEVILKCNRQINDLKRELARYGNGEEGRGMNPNYIKTNFGKFYERKPITPFQKFWNGGVGTYDMPKSHIAVDAWNAALYTARERLQMHGETVAIELLEILYED